MSESQSFIVLPTHRSARHCLEKSFSIETDSTSAQLIAATKSWLSVTDPDALARSVREERNGHERQTKRLVESIESLTIARPGFEPGPTEPNVASVSPSPRQQV